MKKKVLQKFTSDSFVTKKKEKKNDGGNEKNEKFSRNRIKHKDDNKEKKNRNNKF